MEVRLNLSFQTYWNDGLSMDGKGQERPNQKNKFPDIKEIGLHQSGEHAYI